MVKYFVVFLFLIYEVKVSNLYSLKHMGSIPTPGEDHTYDHGQPTTTHCKVQEPDKCRSQNRLSGISYGPVHRVKDI